MGELKNWFRIALVPSSASMERTLRQTTAITHLTFKRSPLTDAIRGMSWISSVWDWIFVFAEVRARAASALVGCHHSIDTHKKRVLQRGSKAYINQLQNPLKHVRFDVIDVSLSDEGEGDVRHYGNLPLFSKHYTTSHESRY